MSQPTSVPPPPQPLLAVVENQPQLLAPPGVPEHFTHKNRLHTSCQKMSIPIPVYETRKEGGAPHAPMYRATVLVDNTYYTTQKFFTNVKTAEQEVAKIALDALIHKISNEGYSFIHEDTIFCKSVLNEYASKMHLDPPTFNTTQHQNVVAFTSSLVFNGVTYNGPVARNKKEAEQLAARVAILSIMGNPSPDSALISSIIKSKYKPFDAFHQANNSNTTQGTPMLNDNGLNLGSQGKENVRIGATNDAANIVAIENQSAQIAEIPVQTQPFHEFKKPRLDKPPAAAITAPITFVSPVGEQNLGGSPSSSKKRRKKAKKNRQPAAQFPPHLDPTFQVGYPVPQ